MVLRRRWWIVGCTAGVTVVAAILSFIQTPTYEATCRLYLNRQRVQALPFSDIYQKPQIFGRANDLLMTQIEIILSTPVIEGAVRDLESQGKLDFNTAYAKPSGGLLSRLLGRGTIPGTPDERRNAYVAKLQDHVSV